MSGIGETRQRAGLGWRVAWQVASWPARLLRVLLGLALVAVVLLAAGAVGLAWRLAQGPLDVTWLMRRAEALFVSPDTPARVAIGRASLAWNGFNGGADSGLKLQLHDLRAVDPAGTPGARVAQADVTLSPSRLAAAQVAPQEVTLSGVQVRAVRDLDGAIRFDLAGPTPASGDSGGASLSDVLAELRRPADSGGSGLSALQHVVVQHAQLVLEDEASRQTLQGDISTLDLRRKPGGGVTGAAEASIKLGDAVATLKLDADLLADGGTHLTATLAPLRTSAVAAMVPSPGLLGLLDTTVEASASLDLSAALRPLAATIDTSTGAGTLALPGGPLTFRRLALQAGAHWTGSSWQPSDLTIPVAEAVLGVPGTDRATTIRARIDATRSEADILAKIGLVFDHAGFADLPALWPVAWGGHTRPWLTENVTGGVAHDGDFSATLAAPAADPSALKITAAAGTMQADDVTIHWLRPVPPIEHAQATMTVIGPDQLDIVIPRGSQGPMTLHDGVIHFTGLAVKDQFMALETSVDGSVPELLKVLRNPRLQLLSKHPVPMTHERGSIAARLSVDLPLVHELTFEQVAIGAKGRLTGLHLGGVVVGRDLDRGDIGFEVTQEGLQASGPATIAGVPGRAEVMMDFRKGPPTQVQQSAKFAGRVTPAALSASGLDTGGVIDAGTALLDVSYVERRNGLSRVDATADLSAAGLSVAGWRKAPGPPARAAAAVLFDHGRIIGVPELGAHGPGLDVTGRAEMIGNLPRLLHLDRIIVGPTRAQGEIQFPERTGEPLRVRLVGPVVDLSGLLRGEMGGGGSGSTPFVADVRIGRVILDQGRSLVDVNGHAEQRQGRLQSLRLTSGGPERLQATILPAGTGRKVTVRVADTGALLRGLDVFQTLDGGALAVDAQYDDRFADPPLAGTVQLGNFGLRDSVVVGKLLQAVTLYGIPDALRGRGVYFARLNVPFCFCQNVLRLGASRAYSASLGVTAQGWVDFSRKLADVSGTIVPAYAVNSALGRIPLIGPAFTAERDGGLIAVRYSVTGDMAKPAVTVNPLSALTPGILRRLFDLFS